MLCYYGCGQEAKFQLKNGNWVCTIPYQRCPVIRKINSESKKGREGYWTNKNFSYETKQKMSESHISIKNHMYGKKHTNETKERISKSVIEYLKNETKESKTLRYKKQSLSQIGRLPHNKRTIENITKKYPTFSKEEEMRYNPDKPGEKEIQVHCKYSECPNSKENEGWFTPSLSQINERIRQLEDKNSSDGCHFYCSNLCKEKCVLYNMKCFINSNKKEIVSNEYILFRQEVLKRDNFECAYCGEKAEHVHHTRPQKLEPFFALDPDYAISVCKECHYKYGHKEECSTGQLANIKCNEEN